MSEETYELPPRESWTRRDLAYAAWETSAQHTESRGQLAKILFVTGTKAAFDVWWEARAKVLTAEQYGCPPIVLAIAAWNAARGRDSMVAMPAEDGAAFEKWFAAPT
jgi:hypothetical protein